MKKMISMFVVLMCMSVYSYDVVIDKLVAGYQTEEERLNYVGIPGEIVRNTSTGTLTLYDGVVAGGTIVGTGSGGGVSPAYAAGIGSEYPIYAIGTDIENGDALCELYTSLESIATESIRCTIVAYPGTYEFTNSVTWSSPYIDLRGAVKVKLTKRIEYGCLLTGKMPAATIHLLSPFSFMNDSGIEYSIANMGFTGVCEDMDLGNPTTRVNVTDSTFTFIPGSGLTQGDFTGCVFSNNNTSTLPGGFRESYVIDCYISGGTRFDSNTRLSYCTILDATVSDDLIVSNCRFESMDQHNTYYNSQVIGTSYVPIGTNAFFCIGPAGAITPDDVANRGCIIIP